ncbi:hypothetical protein DEQ92_15785 [Haloferax sp. Atlit-6N]|uniref:Uncharacterized protein n=2 Tax=Haloferax gibbonsii TaxID=35746 RepID=A0A871BIX7_HALGI|nr:MULTISPECIES: DUF5806 family protein [Haloferax]ELZ79358.1 hypothetical protein C454_13723 [Haloferax gibbonsii ATCC 33959]QOS13097.1 uncharacterized protein HfgLR_14845 [Haloferax gibbonsii]RDZ53036.1 hypothetical protein C5C07_14950 [Haloferax sp. Atlit-4N]REA02339.1 hypothetical protein DEQ92_15785 [Haloferax sp. Atlit-6N]
MTDESDEFETGAGDAEEATRADADPGAEADETAADAATATAETTDAEPTDAEAADAAEAGPADADAADPEADADGADSDAEDVEDAVPEDVQKYARFKKVDGAQYDRVNDFLRQRTYVTAREWAIARLCADFRTETGVEMTKIGNNLPELVPFMTDTYTPQAVNQARSAFRDKVRKSGATFLYGAMSGFFTAEELDEMMYEVTEIAKFLLEVEGVDLSVEEELEAEERISSVMREVREASTELRQEELSDEE